MGWIRSIEGAPDVLTVVIADGDAPTRSGIASALAHRGVRVLASSNDAGSAVIAVARHHPDVCLLDPDLPGDGIAAIKAIHARTPKTRIAALGCDTTDQQVLRAIEAGADGYLLKTVAPDRMTIVLRALTRGEVAVPRATSAALVRRLRERGDGTLAAAPRRKFSLGRLLLYVPLYIPRFLRHYRHRRRSNLSVSEAWASARTRMRSYL